METTCVLCQHDKVCKFKSEFEAICEAVPNLEYEAGVNSLKKVRLCDFVKVFAACKYFTEIPVTEKASEPFLKF